MRLARRLASTSVIFLAVSATAQQAPASSTSPAPVPTTGQTIVVKPRVIIEQPDAATPPIAVPDHPATEAQIREYLALTDVSKTTHELLDGMAKAMQSTAVPYLPASYWQDVRGEFAKLDIASLYVPLYQRYFSQEDMQKVIDFYRSPAGKNLMTIQPLLVRDAQSTLGQKGREIGIAIYNRHKDEIDAAKKLYDAQHPPAGTN
jgi:hypothetical protein